LVDKQLLVFKSFEKNSENSPENSQNANSNINNNFTNNEKDKKYELRLVARNTFSAPIMGLALADFRRGGGDSLAVVTTFGVHLLIWRSASAAK
jgi:hypothetical protein